MVKTKKVVSKNPQDRKSAYNSPKKTTRPSLFDGMDEEEPKKKKEKRTPMADVHTEVRPSESTSYRSSNDWWDDVLSGETSRTGDMQKVQLIINKAFQERVSLNIQANAEIGDHYRWYITRIMTEEETTPPSKKGKKK